MNCLMILKEDQRLIVPAQHFLAEKIVSAILDKFLLPFFPVKF